MRLSNKEKLFRIEYEAERKRYGEEQKEQKRCQENASTMRSRSNERHTDERNKRKDIKVKRLEIRNTKTKNNEPEDANMKAIDTNAVETKNMGGKVGANQTAEDVGNGLTSELFSKTHLREQSSTSLAVVNG